MKPKPLVALNHFTVPVVITNPFLAEVLYTVVRRTPAVSTFERGSSSSGARRNKNNYRQTKYRWAVDTREGRARQPFVWKNFTIYHLSVHKDASARTSEA